jgi:hypothetical protein
MSSTLARHLLAKLVAAPLHLIKKGLDKRPVRAYYWSMTLTAIYIVALGAAPFVFGALYLHSLWQERKTK